MQYLVYLLIGSIAFYQVHAVFPKLPQTVAATLLECCTKSPAATQGTADYRPCFNFVLNLFLWGQGASGVSDETIKQNGVRPLVELYDFPISCFYDLEEGNPYSAHAAAVRQEVEKKEQNKTHGAAHKAGTHPGVTH
ncbi:hypothetical protein DdX_10238 [Ditylenchus destructor]|uniref:Uncharacterized protein n=1 Tax=Ditylenchus destructor TaxID=166010 RepID=A0AAD4N1G4_9BILA|nr:hypothetical protein DdX_10238 [Ditylenchus destructor]